jgi:hypothetical protein
MIIVLIIKKMRKKKKKKTQQICNLKKTKKCLILFSVLIMAKWKDKKHTCRNILEKNKDDRKER